MERFDILRLFGKGRTGGVYEAVDLQTNQRIALRRFFSSRGETDSSSWREPFVQLAQNLGQIHHPALMGIYGSGVDQDGAFMMMELLEGGRSIEEIVETSGHLSDENFYVMANNLLDAFSMIHQQGFCHGSVNARSVMEVPLATGGHVYKCVDLGVAALIPLINPDNPVLGFSDPALTAPEIFEGQQPDSRSDVYMLGQLFYLSLAGGHPLAGLSATDAYAKHKAHRFAPLSGYRSSVPKDIVSWIESLTQADPDARPANAGEALSLMPVYQFGNGEVSYPADIMDQQVGTQASHIPVGRASRSMSSAGQFGRSGSNKVASSFEKKSSAPTVAIIAGLALLVLLVALVVKGGSSPQVEAVDAKKVNVAKTEKRVPKSKLSESKERLKRLKDRVKFSKAQIISSGAGASKSLDLAPKESSSWLYFYHGKPKTGGAMEVVSAPPRGGKFSLGSFEMARLSFHGEVVLDGYSWDLGGGLDTSAYWRFNVKNAKFFGKLRGRVFYAVENLAVELEVLRSPHGTGKAIYDLKSSSGVVAVDFSIADVKPDEEFVLDFKAEGLLESGKPAKFIPLAILMYEGGLPPLPVVGSP